MRTGFYLLTFVSLIFICNSSAQIVGRLVDENGDGLYKVNVEAYLGSDVYSSVTDIDGNFSFDNVTSVDEDILPDGYSVSDNYPNPFNPKTRINIVLPQKSQVDVHIYNLLGQQVRETISKVFDAGINSLDLELNGLSNGIYLARISIDQKYSVTKKLMLIYGSQHLNISGNSITNLGKSNLGIQTTMETPIDSLVAHSAIIGRKVFTQLPSYNGELLDIGTFEIIRYCPEIPSITYAGKLYNTVLIGEQCWLKENLDVGTMLQSTSVVFQQTNNGVLEKYCYDNDSANCEIYGGLYEWPEAMQYTTQEGTQGICPEGWHIPTLVEFEELNAIVYGDGNALTAIGHGYGNGAGTNTSGFSAVLGGYRDYVGYFELLNSTANIWSSKVHSISLAYKFGIGYGNSGIGQNDFSRGYGFSVRCVKGQGSTNNPPSVPSNPSPSDSATGVSTTTISWTCSDPDGDSLTYDVYFGLDSTPDIGELVSQNQTSTSYSPGTLNENTIYYWKIVAMDNNGGITEGSVWSFETGSGGTIGVPCPGIPTITYDDKIYHTIQIGNQCWLRENLDIGTMIESNSVGYLQTDNGVIEKYCYNNDPAKCETYGGLYEWPEAMQYTTQEGTQGICPEGWHIPTVAELQYLKAAVNNDGNALKAIGYGAGSTNTSGFSAVLGGYRYSSGLFHDFFSYAYFWSSTEHGGLFADFMDLFYNASTIFLYNTRTDNGFSVRCVKD